MSALDKFGGDDHPRNCQCGHRHELTGYGATYTPCRRCPCRKFTYKDWSAA